MSFTSSCRFTQRPDRSGVTLMELSIVLLILAALAMIAVQYIDPTIGRAEEAATRATMENIRSAILGSTMTTGYYDDMAQYSMLSNEPDSTLIPFLLPSRLPRTLRDLLINPFGVGANEFDAANQLGWRKDGYLRDLGMRYFDPDSPDLKEQERALIAAGFGFTNRYGLPGAPTINDAFRNDLLERSGMPIVIQWPIVNGVYEPQYARLVSAGPNNEIQTPPGQLYPSKASCGDDIVLYLFVVDQRPD